MDEWFWIVFHSFFFVKALIEGLAREKHGVVGKHFTFLASGGLISEQGATPEEQL